VENQLAVLCNSKAVRVPVVENYTVSAVHQKLEQSLKQQCAQLVDDN